MPHLIARDLLISYFHSEELKPGTRLPSERALASRFGLSQAVVNRIILQHIAQGMLRRDGYKLVVVGAAPEQPPLRLWSFISDAIPQRAVLETAKSCACELHSPTSHEENQIRKALLNLDPGEVDGILIWGTHSEDLLEQMHQAGIPLMLCGTSSETYSYVTVDDRRLGTLAVEHLAELGHQRLAYVTLSSALNYGQNWHLAIEGYRETCRRLGLNDSADRIEPMSSDTPAEVERIWRSLDPSTSAITAIICPNAHIANHLSVCAMRDGLTVPSDLSLLCLRDGPSAASAELPLTAFSDESSTVARLGLLLLHEKASRKRAHQGGKRHQVVVIPSLVVRASTAPNPDGIIPPRVPSPHIRPPSRAQQQIQNWASDPLRRAEQASALNAKPFPAASAPLHLYSPLDLSRVANRSCAREHGWLGDEPLRHLPSADVHFHGVPFRLLNEDENHRHVAIVLKSSKARTSGGHPLPSEMTIPLRRKASAIYVLHGAGWTTHHLPFAEYQFVYTKTDSEKVAVVAYAHGPQDPALEAPWREESILQDWHPNYLRFESRHALPCVITDEGDPLGYERYLYAWQWINPHPERCLQALRIRMLKPDEHSTIGILAITLQK